jgi:hypothetical protein
MKFETITISDWEQLLDLEPEFGGWVYRGHSNTDWELETSLHRTVSNNQIGYTADDSEYFFAERASLKSFKSRAHFYLDHLPQDEDLAAWLAVMQHHGTPTRLLDFTYSLYVAAYFALINATTDSCIWAVNDGWLRSQGTKYAKKLKFNPSNELRYGKLRCIYQAANSVIAENSFDADGGITSSPAVLMIEIERQIPRLAIQQGVFLMPTDLTQSFTKNLEAMGGWESEPLGVMRKIVFDHKLRCHALMHLRMMNITAETLFPGIVLMAN